MVLQGNIKGAECITRFASLPTFFHSSDSGPKPALLTFRLLQPQLNLSITTTPPTVDFSSQTFIHKAFFFFFFSYIIACANTALQACLLWQSVPLTLLRKVKCTMSTFASNTELSFSEWGIIVFKSVFNLSRQEDYAAKSPFRAVSSPPTPLP